MACSSKTHIDDIEDSNIANTSSAHDDSASKTMLSHIKLIEQMRAAWNAPVDLMGSHVLGDKSLEPKVFRFQTLVALILSSQTKDQITAAAMERLKLNGCTPEKITQYSQEELERLLTPVGFYRRKSEYLKKTATILQEKYDGDIPDTLQDLCNLPGVGIKMAHLALQICFNKTEGIGVDTHVHRISNRLGWIQTSTPEQTETELQKTVPRNYWGTINQLLVGFGQQICLPTKPKCYECQIGNEDLCPWFRKENKSRKNTKKKQN